MGVFEVYVRVRLRVRAPTASVRRASAPDESSRSRLCGRSYLVLRWLVLVVR